MRRLLTSFKNFYSILFSVFVFFQISTANAAPSACVSLVSGGFNKSDVSKAYSFVKNHGECLDRLGDTSFQAITGVLFSLKALGKISENTCSKLLTASDSDAVKTLTDAVGGNVSVISQNLSCGCAVAYSGVDKKLKDIVDKIIECGKSFNPVDWAEDGLKAASGAVEGLGSVFGVGGKYAEGANGGAPTSYYLCTVGKWFDPADSSPVGVCTCPPKHKIEDGGSVYKGLVRCVADCPKNQILKDNKCQPCPADTSNKKYNADEVGLSCVAVGFGFKCAEGKKTTSDGKGCEFACETGSVWDTKQQACKNCESGTVPKYVSSMSGSLGTCEACNRGTHPINYKCEPCPEGANWQAPGFCVSSFPSKKCKIGNLIQDPSNPQVCKLCPAGMIANTSHTDCIDTNVQSNSSPTLMPSSGGTNSRVLPSNPLKAPTPDTNATSGAAPAATPGRVMRRTTPPAVRLTPTTTPKTNPTPSPDEIKP